MSVGEVPKMKSADNTSPRRLLVTGGAGLLAQFCPLLVQRLPI